MVLFKTISQQSKLVGGFLLIVLIHITFKTYLLNYNGFWYDETFGLFFSQQDWGLIKHTSEWDLNPPFYYYFLWVWRHLFGISEFAIRFSSVLFSALAAGMIYVFSVKHFNKITAIIALIIYSSSNEIFFYAHEARCYSILFFLTICSSHFYFNLLNKKSISSSISLGIINFLLIYTHYLTGLILLFQAILMLLFFNKQFAKQISIAFIITLSLSLWRFTKKTILLIFIPKKSFWLTKPSFYDLKVAIYDLFNTKEIFFFYLALIVLALIVIYLTDPHIYLRKTIALKPIYLLLSGFGVIIICYMLSIITPIFTKRYVVYTIPFICVLIGYIISKINNIKLKYTAIVLICITSLYSFSKIDFYTPKPMNYKNAMGFIKAEKNFNTLTLVETKDMGALFAYYFDKNIFMDYKNLEPRLKESEIYLISTSEDLKVIDFNKYNKVILTQTFVKQGPENDILIKYISIHYKNQLVNKNFTGVDILVFNN